MATPPMLDPRDPAPAVSAVRRADPAVSVTVFLLALTFVGLYVGATLAVYDWTVPGAITPLIYSVIGIFAAAIGVQVAAATVRWARRGAR